jgi:hypothetical protein
MPLPATFDIESYYNSELALEFTYKDAANDPIDLTSSTVRCVIRDSASDPKAGLVLEIGSGITITDAENGVFTLTVTASQVASLGQLGKRVVHVYDLYVISGSTQEIIVRGDFAVGSGT